MNSPKERDMEIARTAWEYLAVETLDMEPWNSLTPSFQLIFCKAVQDLLIRLNVKHEAHL